MSNHEHPLPEWPGFPWGLVTLRRYRRNVVGENRSNYPPGFMEVVERYTDQKFVFQSEIWQGLQKWREYAERNPEAAPSCRLTPRSNDERESVECFKELILAAVFYGQDDILQTLSETVTLTQAPDPDVHAVRAVITAFSDLFNGASEDDWPLKLSVRKRAIEILKKAGSPIPSTSPEWAHAFKKAGLSKLRTATRKSKRIG